MLRRETLQRLCRARERLREFPERAPTIGDVAREARMSRYQFIRRFAALFGETPHQYRIRARLEHARQLLAGGRHSVTEVCMEVGFTSLGSFSDLFARRVGMTPSAYRRRVRAHELIPGCLTLMTGLPGAISEKREPRRMPHCEASFSGRSPP